jgi:exosome complex RNA-binding protein Rrp42 (RNase PH superfamily)
LEGVLSIYVNDEMTTHDQTDGDDLRGNALGRLLERLFKSGRTVDTESLCILPGERVWSIRLDIHVLEDAGNVLDASSMAALAALLDFRRPDSTVVDGQAVIVLPLLVYAVYLNLLVFSGREASGPFDDPVSADLHFVWHL